MARFADDISYQEPRHSLAWEEGQNQMKSCCLFQENVEHVLYVIVVVVSKSWQLFLGQSKGRETDNEIDELVRFFDVINTGTFDFFSSSVFSYVDKQAAAITYTQ